MAKLIQCDRCEKQSKLETNFAKVIITTQHTSTERKYDLCTSCVVVVEANLSPER